MRTFITFFLFCVLTVCAKETTTKVYERRNPDGTLQLRLETTSRGKTAILRVYQTFKAGKTTTSRSYMVDGELMMIEADDDGDGFFEEIALFRPETDEMEVFFRERDGSVRPVSAQTLAAHKKQHKAIKKLWEKGFDKDKDADKFVERLQETQQELQEAEKEKKGK